MRSLSESSKSFTWSILRWSVTIVLISGGLLTVREIVNHGFDVRHVGVSSSQMSIIFLSITLHRVFEQTRIELQMAAVLAFSMFLAAPIFFTDVLTVGQYAALIVLATGALCSIALGYTSASTEPTE